MKCGKCGATENLRMYATGGRKLLVCEWCWEKMKSKTRAKAAEMGLGVRRQSGEGEEK